MEMTHQKELNTPRWKAVMDGLLDKRAHSFKYVFTLKWWISDSMSSFIDARGGGEIL